MKVLSRVLALITVAVSSLMSVGAAQARELCPPGFESLCQLKLAEDTGSIVATVITIFILIAVFTSLFFMLLGGFRWVTSGGDQNKVASARSTLIAAIVGLVISLSVFFILSIVLYLFTGKGLELLNVEFKL